MTMRQAERGGRGALAVGATLFARSSMLESFARGGRCQVGRGGLRFGIRLSSRGHAFPPNSRCEIVTGVMPLPTPSTVTRAPSGSVVTTSCPSTAGDAGRSVVTTAAIGAGVETAVAAGVVVVLTTAGGVESTVAGEIRVAVRPPFGCGARANSCWLSGVTSGHGEDRPPRLRWEPLRPHGEHRAPPRR